MGDSKGGWCQGLQRFLLCFGAWGRYGTFEERLVREACEVPSRLVNHLGDEALTRLRRQFSWFDTEGLGYIEVSILPELLRHSGYNPTDPALDTWMDELRIRNDGKLTFPGFVEWWISHIKELEDDMETLTEAFRYFDKDKDGKIDPAEFRKTVHACLSGSTPGVVSISDSDLSTFWAYLDRDANGFVTYEELLSFIREDRLNCLAGGFSGEDLQKLRNRMKFGRAREKKKRLTFQKMRSMSRASSIQRTVSLAPERSQSIVDVELTKSNSLS